MIIGLEASAVCHSHKEKRKLAGEPQFVVAILVFRGGHNHFGNLSCDKGSTLKVTLYLF